VVVIERHIADVKITVHKGLLIQALPVLTATQIFIELDRIRIGSQSLVYIFGPSIPLFFKGVGIVRRPEDRFQEPACRQEISKLTHLLSDLASYIAGLLLGPTPEECLKGFRSSILSTNFLSHDQRSASRCNSTRQLDMTEFVFHLPGTFDHKVGV
jgi:hypothetical protein